MSAVEKRLSEAIFQYTSRFGNDSYPDIDMLPEAYLDSARLAELLEKCVREGKEVRELVAVREYEPGLIY
jgi:hypothetical protein